MEHHPKAQYPMREFRWILTTIGCIASLVPVIAFAQNEANMEKAKAFLSNISMLLNMASIVIVAATLLFVVYQLVLRRQKFEEVRAILFGGLLIGAAAQIARVLLPDDVTSTAMMLSQTFLLAG